MREIRVGMKQFDSMHEVAMDRWVRGLDDETIKAYRACLDLECARRGVAASPQALLAQYQAKQLKEGEGKRDG